MKTFIVLAVSIVLVSILFCPMVMAAPAMPADLQMVQPDPSLPRELSAFLGKWEGSVGASFYLFLIVEKIDEENASLYFWRGGNLAEAVNPGWQRAKGTVIKEGRKYKLWYYAPGPTGNVFLTVKGEYLETSTGVRLRRVPTEEKKVVEVKPIGASPVKEQVPEELKKSDREKPILDQKMVKKEENQAVTSKYKPVIIIAYPKDEITVDSEYVNLFGAAEHEKGISKFEILLNDKPIESKDRRNVQLVPKGQKRVEFSEKVRLREGQNKIAILVQSEEGLTNQKIISVHLAKKREEVYAVVIGINKYKNLSSLKYAVNDAREFYRYLVEVNQVPKDHIWLLLDEEATLEKLRTTLGTLLRKSAGRDDTVIIFLAGHGATEQDASSPDGDGLEKYVLPHNADPKNLYATAMPMSEVARIFQRISSERLVFISDTCYSGASGGRTIPLTGRRANVSGAFLERLSQGKGRVIITASDANEVSMERDDMKHGVFTYYLLEGLRGKADFAKDGVITVDEVYRYISTKVPQATGQNQHPLRKGETTGQIVLGVVK